MGSDVPLAMLIMLGKVFAYFPKSLQMYKFAFI